MNNIERLKAKLKNAANTSNEAVPSGNEIKDENINNDKTLYVTEFKSIDNNSVILSQKLIEIDVLELQSNPFQPRTKFENIEDLADNIFRHGLLQPITVYFNDIDNKYYIIAGERRSRAIKLLHARGNLKDTKFKVNLVENLLTDEDKKMLATLENTHRDNMTIIDMANNAASYIQNGMSYSEVAELFSVGKTVVSRYIKIARLPKKVQDILNTKEVKSPNKIELLSEINNIDIQIEFAKLILEDISINQLETKIKKYLKSIKTPESKVVIESPFDKVKPVSKIISKAKYRKLTESDKAKADEILEEMYRLQLKLQEYVI